MKKVFLVMALAAICAVQMFADEKVYQDTKTGLYFTVSQSRASSSTYLATIVARPDGELYNKETLTIPATVVYSSTYYTVLGVGMEAFKGETKLKKVDVGDNALLIIGSQAFANCTALEEVNLKCVFTDDTRKANLANAFRKELMITSTTVGPTIAPKAFEGCTALQKVTPCDETYQVAQSVFSGCTSLTRVDIDDTFPIQKWGDKCFENCKSLSSFVVSEKVKYFGSHVFSGCDKLDYIEWYSTKVEDFAGPEASPFYDIRNNEDFEIEVLCELKRVPAYICYGMQSMSYIFTAEEIGAHAFDGAKYDGNRLYLEDVKKIEEGALNGPKFNVITLPQTPIEIADENVFGADNLDGSTQFIVMSPANCDANALYKTAAGWTNIKVEAQGEHKAPAYEVVCLDEHYTGTGTGSSTSTPTITRYASCDDNHFTVEFLFEPKFTSMKTGEENIVIPFGYFEYNGIKYYGKKATIEQTDVNEKLKLVYTADVPEGVDNVNGAERKYQKVVRGGNVYIIRDGKTFNMLGAEVK